MLELMITSYKLTINVSSYLQEYIQYSKLLHPCGRLEADRAKCHFHHVDDIYNTGFIILGYLYISLWNPHTSEPTKTPSSQVHLLLQHPCPIPTQKSPCMVHGAYTSGTLNPHPSNSLYHSIGPGVHRLLNNLL